MSLGSCGSFSRWRVTHFSGQDGFQFVIGRGEAWETNQSSDDGFHQEKDHLDPTGHHSKS
jgi:hypothetical protein